MSNRDAVVVGAGPAGLGAASLARPGGGVRDARGRRERARWPLRDPPARGLRLRPRRPHPVRAGGVAAGLARGAARLRAALGRPPGLVRARRRDRAAAATSTSGPTGPEALGDRRRDGRRRAGRALRHDVRRPGDAAVPGEDRRPARWSASPTSARGACSRTRPPPDGFHFPARGIGQLMDAMAAAAREAGAEVLLGSGGRGDRRARRQLSAPCGWCRTGSCATSAPRPRSSRCPPARPPGCSSRAAPGSLTRPVRMRAVCIVLLRVARGAAERRALDPGRRSRGPVRARLRAAQLEPRP